MFDCGGIGMFSFWISLAIRFSTSLRWTIVKEFESNETLAGGGARGTIDGLEIDGLD